MGILVQLYAGLLFEGGSLLISLLVAISTPALDVLADWILAVSVQSFSWYFTTWDICVRAKKCRTNRKTRESDTFRNCKDNGDGIFLRRYSLWTCPPLEHLIAQPQLLALLATSFLALGLQ
jgi:hypothetical protein